MIKTDRVVLPSPIEVRLKNSAAFVDNIMEFARDDLIGFKRPLAATFAFTSPIVMAFAFYAGGVEPLIKTALSYCLVAFSGLYLVGRASWPGIVTEFETRSLAKRRAQADLRCGFGEASFLNLERPARFFEHDHGVLVFADAGDFRTLFFSVQNADDDPRWDLYLDGELDRRVWRWLRLPVSREVVRFSTEASKLTAAPVGAKRISSIDAWEAINLELGEPVDGAIIHRPFDETVEAVERRL